MIAVACGIVTIIAVWLFELPIAWAVSLTILSAIVILGGLSRIARFLDYLANN